MATVVEEPRVEERVVRVFRLLVGGHAPNKRTNGKEIHDLCRRADGESEEHFEDRLERFSRDFKYVEESLLGRSGKPEPVPVGGFTPGQLIYTVNVDLVEKFPEDPQKFEEVAFTPTDETVPVKPPPTLEELADQQAVEQQDEDGALDKMTLKELKRVAEDEGVDVSKLRSKPRVREAILRHREDNA